MKKSERLNQELIFLRDKYSFQLEELIAEFDISKRTALRDIQELEAILYRTGTQRRLPLIESIQPHPNLF